MQPFKIRVSGYPSPRRAWPHWSGQERYTLENGAILFSSRSIHR